MLKKPQKWIPSRWTENTIRLRVQRIYKYAYAEMKIMIGPYEANLIYCQIKTALDSDKSATKLRQLGIPLIGDSAKRDA